MKTFTQKIFVLLLALAATCGNAMAQLNISFSISSHNGFNISCNGGNNGWITANVTGGTAPYTYQWSIPALTTQTISNLPASYYAVTVTDALGATAESGVTLRDPQPIAITLTSPLYPNGYNVSCYQCFNGSITTAVQGGVNPYTFSWSDGTPANPITTQNRSSVGGILYIVIVTDVNGCPKGKEILITEPQRSDWTMTGNIGSNPSTNYIGTTDNQDLVFKTNATERMRIKADGKLTLSGETSLSRLVVSRIVSPDSLIYMGDSTLIFHHSQNRLYGDMGLVYRGTGIGIGTRALGSRSIAIGSYCEAQGAFSTAIGRSVATSTNATNSIIIGSRTLSAGSFFTNDVENSLMVGFNTYGNVPTLFVGPADGTQNSVGKVGIGTTTIPSGYLLAVNGKIICKEVKVVATLPPDFVFEKDYKLMSLKELADYILIHHHLPEIPSAAEMKADEGIAVGDFQMKLLQKIEELTLYIIEQQKQIDELKQQIKK